MKYKSYAELLECREWKLKRGEIITKDHSRCTSCNNFKLEHISKEGKILNTKILRGYLVLKGVRKDKVKIVELIYDYIIRFKSIFSDVEHELYLRPGDYFFDDVNLNKYKLFFSREADKEGLEKLQINLIKSFIKGIENVVYARGLHVHHKYYQEGLLPWQYPDSALTTLCWMCHKKLHANQQVDWYDAKGVKKGSLTPCYRCSGAGYFPEYSHVQSGVCFRCGGAKFEEFINKRVEEITK